jgi:hypothetical protein
MLKDIRYISCSPALSACRRLQEQLIAWICDPNIDKTDINQTNLAPPRVTTQIEADWLWAFLLKVDAGETLLARAQTLTDMKKEEKAKLIDWVNAVSNLENQFQDTPPHWPISNPSIPQASWQAFKKLMEAFYEKGLRGGLPYAADGTPTATGGITYNRFVQDFRDAHRLTANADAREVCVLCGGPLDGVEVDHWIAKSLYPVLSVSADNLLPICGKCNSTDNKGSKPVHSQGSFADWFHPYWRHTNGGLQLSYQLPPFSIVGLATKPEDAAKVANLDKLLNLNERWTREFKAEYAKQQSVLLNRERRRISKGENRHTQEEIITHLQQVQEDLVPSEPHYEVHKLLFSALLDPTRLLAWQIELDQVN